MVYKLAASAKRVGEEKEYQLKIFLMTLSSLEIIMVIFTVIYVLKFLLLLYLLEYSGGCSLESCVNSFLSKGLQVGLVGEASPELVFK